ncbi:uncharacterized protein LOC131429167 [Malaya genurostris]|uniref:uncharacterized protein LOC131429167 n=1 Tax=Malaya genurostris TaxID=325434 RepID=UPI0026F3EEBB|nr:uncharacterized protein LOC131429167 [Malaya genurostris]
MVVRRLETFLQDKVPNGYSNINIKDEIEKYFRDVDVASSPPKPIVVVATSSLIVKVCRSDTKAQLCGGRFQSVCTMLDNFFSKMTNLGVELVFYVHEPLMEPKYKYWYQGLTEVVDCIDGGTDMAQLRKKNHYYPDIASYANEVGAYAVLACSSSYLIYEGRWRLWSTRDVDFDHLETMEYNRSALLQTLNLNYRQMQLFAVLAGDDSLPYGQILKFQTRMAFIVSKNVQSSLFTRFNQCHQREMENIATTNTRHGSFSPSVMIDLLLKQDDSFMYDVWVGQSINISAIHLDMRRREFGMLYPDLAISLTLRMAGIILYYKGVEECTQVHLYIKPKHEDEAVILKRNAILPKDITPPSLPELFSKEKEVYFALEDRKLQLYCWIGSETLNYQTLSSIPEQLRVTAVTLYYLREKNIVQLFEADLLLQVAYDVIFESFKCQDIQYPHRLDSRAFHVVFIFQAVYYHFHQAVKRVGLDWASFRGYLPFDGVRFHMHYDYWKQHKGNLEQIAPWRIYKHLLEHASSNSEEVK